MSGSLTLIIGPMFASKTTTLLSFIEKYDKQNYPILIIKHQSDMRYGKDDIIYTHDKKSVSAMTLSQLNVLFKEDCFRNAKAIFIDEGQFFPDIYDFILNAVDGLNKIVFVSALDGDFERRPFPEISKLIPLCDDIIKLKAVCKYCQDGEDALFSWKKKETHIEIGASELYTPLCRKHYLVAVATKSI